MSLRDDVQILNRVLGIENAAYDTYTGALHGVSLSTEPMSWDIARIAEDHQQAAARIEQQINALGGEPDRERRSSSWPSVKRDVRRRLHEDRRALHDLRECERMGLGECAKALGDESSYGPARIVVSDQILPMLRRHVEVLETYLQ